MSYLSKIRFNHEETLKAAEEAAKRGDHDVAKSFAFDELERRNARRTKRANHNNVDFVALNNLIASAQDAAGLVQLKNKLQEISKAKTFVLSGVSKATDAVKACDLSQVSEHYIGKDGMLMSDKEAKTVFNQLVQSNRDRARGRENKIAGLETKKAKLNGVVRQQLKEVEVLSTRLQSLTGKEREIVQQEIQTLLANITPEKEWKAQIASIDNQINQLAEVVTELTKENFQISEDYDVYTKVFNQYGPQFRSLYYAETNLSKHNDAIDMLQHAINKLSEQLNEVKAELSAKAQLHRAKVISGTGPKAATAEEVSDLYSKIAALSVPATNNDVATENEIEPEIATEPETEEVEVEVTVETVETVETQPEVEVEVVQEAAEEVATHTIMPNIMQIAAWANENGMSDAPYNDIVEAFQKAHTFTLPVVIVQDEAEPVSVEIQMPEDTTADTEYQEAAEAGVPIFDVNISDNIMEAVREAAIAYNVDLLDKSNKDLDDLIYEAADLLFLDEAEDGSLFVREEYEHRNESSNDYDFIFTLVEGDVGVITQILCDKVLAAS